MTISQKIEKMHKNRVESIKKMKNTIDKDMAIGSLVCDLGNRAITAVAKAIGSCFRKVKKCKELFQNQFTQLKLEFRGRKKIEEISPQIINHIKEICENSEFVDKSLQDHIVYIDITPKVIIKQLKIKYHYEKCPCENTIRRILKEKLGYKLTKVKKNKIQKKIKETDAIFNNVWFWKWILKLSGDNIVGISIDDKTSKYVGELSGGGYSWITRNALDHDTLPEYIIKPFGILDLKTKQPYVFCTTSNSTADFKVDAIEEYLQRKLKENKAIDTLIIFLDNGPENSSRRTLWRYRIGKLMKDYNIHIQLVYYPPYHSKYNPVEHFWGVLQNHWSGLIIDTLEKLVGSINSCTWDGIQAQCFLRTKEYKKGSKVNKKELEEIEKKYIFYNNENIKTWSMGFYPASVSNC